MVANEETCGDPGKRWLWLGLEWWSEGGEC